MMMKRLILAALALALPAPATAQSLTLTNLKPRVTNLCPAASKATTIAAFMAILAGCNTPAPTPAPTPTAPAVTFPTLEQGTFPAWGHGGVPGPYAENEGAFRFICSGDGPLKRDDPVVYPGKPGAAHLHQVWGNRLFDASLTTDRLLASADSNCNETPFSLNRSSYWQPALLHDSGQVVRPDLVSVYYKRLRSISRECRNAEVGVCTELPKGLKFLMGWDQYRPAAPVRGAWWYCSGVDGHFPDLDAVFAAGCKPGADLVANTVGATCWDGKNLDSTDHRSHMSYTVPRKDGSGGETCPATHRYLIPQQENKVQFRVTADMIGADGRSRVRLSSDHMLAGAKPGQTLHADYMEGWVDSARKAWHEGCIDKGLSCSGGDLGNGRMLHGAREPKYGWTMPQPRVAVP